MPETLFLDLRDVNAMPWARLWGSVLGGDVATEIDRVLQAQVIDPNAPLMPDLCATAPIIAQAIRTEAPGKVEILVPLSLGAETRLVLSTIARRLGAIPSVFRAGTVLTGSTLRPMPPPPDTVLAPKTLIAEGRASEVAAHKALTVQEQAATLLHLRRPQEAADLPGLCNSARGLRLAVLATRGAGLMNRLPDLRRRVLESWPETRLEQAWHLFDLAVASADDPVRLGYLESLTAARALAWGQSDQLDAGLALWGATYHFHAGRLRFALAGHHVGLKRLERLGAVQRAIHVRIRLAHLNAVCGRSMAARTVASQGIEEATLLDQADDADSLAFSSGAWRIMAGGPPDTPAFRSSRASDLGALWRIIADGLQPATPMPDASDRLWAEALLARSTRIALNTAEKNRLAAAQTALNPIDRDMHQRHATRLRGQSPVPVYP